MRQMKTAPKVAHEVISCECQVFLDLVGRAYNGLQTTNMSQYFCRHVITSCKMIWPDATNNKGVCKRLYKSGFWCESNHPQKDLEAFCQTTSESDDLGMCLFLSCYFCRRNELFTTRCSSDHLSFKELHLAISVESMSPNILVASLVG